MSKEHRPCFIIAHKWVRNSTNPYQSYLKHYIDNIRRLYPNSMTIVVDNNSLWKEDIFSTIENGEDLVFLDNDTDSKFEVGAYTVGCKYALDNNLNSTYDYFVFTQDTFVLKNKYDFNILDTNGILACPLMSYNQDGYGKEVCDAVLSSMGINDNIDKTTFCWCNSFVVEKSRLNKLHSLISKAKVTNKHESGACERWLARVIWELSDGKNWDIDGNITKLRTKYHEWTVDVFGHVPTYFVKRIQWKNENTKDS